MNKMNKIDALRIELKCREMTEGTTLMWYQAIKYEGRIFAFNPYFNGIAANYRVALGVVEGKPVWEGDTLFTIQGDAVLAQSDHKYPGVWSWNSSKPKTVMVELLVEDARFYSLNCFSLGEACRRALRNLE